MTGRTAVNDTGVIITARAESTRGMTYLAIVRADGHVLIEQCGQRKSGRIDTVMTVVAALRQDSRVGVVDVKGRGEALGGMTGPTIGRGCRMGRHRRRLGGRTDTGAVVVT